VAAKWIDRNKQINSIKNKIFQENKGAVALGLFELSANATYAINHF
jgi:hypothetical protein